MNARKYAWQILHTEIRRRCAADEGLGSSPQSDVITDLLLKNADEEGISKNSIIIELAMFGASIVELYVPKPLEVAKAIERVVLFEPDEPVATKDTGHD